MNSDIRVCASGDLWVGGSVGSLETAVHEVFTSARDHIFITCYSITGGANALFDALRGALDRGVLTRLAINKITGQSADAVGQLRALGQSYPHFELWNFVSANGADLHAKVVCADECMAVIGSSNLSFRGLVSNYELGVVVRGEPARIVSDRLRALFSSRSVQRFR
jgi:cardiolipin synthase